eukprot:TRINITY_DN36459_c0_g1_i1.p1 TRINITY_DN36459_c0_g1~~TRINITY_DN36459_c0_g1_i1.p1  ORF type:complete len:160 (+),score=27.95 TRINITY_DN36459_c0_g1_i1:177-656(+)
MTDLINPTPEIYQAAKSARTTMELEAELNDDLEDPIDALEVYNIIRGIKDPEHPNSLEQLRVLQPDHVEIDDVKNVLSVRFTPTVPHCSMTTLIGLCIRVKLNRCLPPRFKTDVYVTPGSHEQETAVNKQLRDKERVAAALENNNLMNVVEKCLTDLEE